MHVLRQQSVATVQAGLVRSVRGAFAGEASPACAVGRIAALLPLFLGHPVLLRPEERRADPRTYRQHLLHAEDDGSFSISALVWLPGQKTSIHNHVCWGVVGIHQGGLREEEYRLEGEADERFLVPTHSEIRRFGEVTPMTPPEDIHRIVNASPEVTISLHIYGTDVRKLETSIREKYGCPSLARRRWRRPASEGGGARGWGEEELAALFMPPIPHPGAARTYTVSWRAPPRRRMWMWPVAAQRRSALDTTGIPTGLLRWGPKI